MRLPLLICVAFLAACSKPRRPGLELEATAKGFRPGCWEVTGTDRENPANTATTQIPVTASRPYSVGMSAPEGWSGSWSLIIVAREASCTGPTVARIEEDIELPIESPVPVRRYELSATDSDGDGFVSLSSGGTDCDDTQAMRRPGLAEQCDDGLDNDCSSGADCADAFCGGKDCDDGDFCTVGEQCSAVSRTCTAGAPRDCGAPSQACRAADAGACTGGGCSWPLLPAGASCGGGAGMACRGDGVCVLATTELNCADGRDDDNDDAGIDCGDSDCAGVSCDAGLCVMGATCSAGTCAGQPKDCGAPAACEDAGVCNPLDGTCAFPTSPVGSTCSDSNPCSVGETCDVAGNCVGGAPLSCASPDVCRAGACDAGACVFTPMANGMPCDDDAGCSYADSCLGGTCTGMPYVCAPAPACRAPGVCLGDGGCSFVADNSQNGAACGDAGICMTGTCLDFPYAVSNVSTTLFPPTNGRVLINCTVTFNTTDGGVTGNWCGGPAPAVSFTTQLTGSAAPAVVLSTRNFEITGDGGFLRLIGSRPVIVLVYGTAPVIIEGRLDAHAARSVPGAGGNHAQCGAQRGNNGLLAAAGTGSDVGTGGGGAGFATRGGNGGASSWTQPLRGGDGGAIGPLTPLPLYGGCSGGVGGITNLGGLGAAGIGCTGGAGGGAIQISAAGPIRVGGSAVISCSGGGGAAPPARGGHGGCGGGSGGVLVLEGAALELAAGAWLTSNGGGGSEGSDYTNTGADPGDDGTLASAIPASGGEGLAAFGGDGGLGGAGALPPVSPPPFYTGGGGGGSTGRVFLRASGACMRSASFSPAPIDFGGCP